MGDRTRPDLRLERELLERYGGTLVGGIDECGRGALSGMVTCAIAVAPADAVVLDDLRDSKQVPKAQRDDRSESAKQWCTAWAVGHASPQEIDEHGIVIALRYAAWRAYRQLPVRPDVLLLDGPHDYITGSQGSLFDTDQRPDDLPIVVTEVKADARCATVAAASLIAKATRDKLMQALAAHFPEYGWDVNAGYGTSAHDAAIARLGLTPHHRHTWFH